MEIQKSRGEQATLAEFETSFSMDEGIWREAYWGDMRVGYETYLTEFDDAPLLRGLPNDRCQCPHWGYLLSGRMTVRYANHEEIVEPGTVYYMAPDHSIKVEPGTVLIEFSPLDEWEKLTEVTEKNISELVKDGTDAQ